MAADNYSDVVQVLAKQIVEACMQTLKKNMQGLIAGATISADQIEGEVSNVNTTNLAIDADHVQGLAPMISNMIGGSSINVSQLIAVDGEGTMHSIATYDPVNNLLSIPNLNVQSEQVKDLEVEYGKLWMAEIGKAEIQTALIDTLHSKFAEIAQAKISEAQIDTAQITGLTAVSANIADLLVQNANIDWAQIKTLGADDVIMQKGLGGKLYIADLAVTDANMVSLTVGQLVVKGDKGGYYQVTVEVDSDGNPTLRARERIQIGTSEIGPMAVTGTNIADSTINGDTKIIESSITARTLNVQDIFAENALVLKLIAQHIDVNELFANSAFINKLNTTDITGNGSLQLAIQNIFDSTMEEISIRLADDRIVTTVIGSQGFSDMVDERTRATVTSTYAVSDSGTEPPADDAEWTEEIPDTGNGEYLWTKVVTEYANGGEPSVVYHVALFGVHGADSIVLKVTSDTGTIYKDTTGTMTLTADVYAGGRLLSQAETMLLGTIKWYRNGSRIPALNWHQITVNLAVSSAPVIYSARLMG